MVYVNGRPQQVLVVRPRPISSRVAQSSIGGWVPSNWESFSETDENYNEDEHDRRSEQMPHPHRLQPHDLIVTAMDEDDDEALAASCDFTVYTYQRPVPETVIFDSSQDLEQELSTEVAGNEAPLVDLNDALETLGIIQVNPSEDTEEHEIESDGMIITRSQYAQILQLSEPMSFSLPNIPFTEQNPDESAPLEAHDDQENSIPLSDFEESLSRIARIQSELRDIRRLYDEILQLTPEVEDNEDSTEDVGELVSRLDIHSTRHHRSHSHLFHDAHHEEEFPDSIDVMDHHLALEPLIRNPADFEDITDEVDDPLDPIVWHPASAFNRYFDEENLEEDHNYEITEDDDAAEDELTDLEAHLDAYAERIHLQHEARLTQFQSGLHNLAHRHTRYQEVMETPTFFLDSNGDPRVSYEPTLDRQANTVRDHSCLEVKAPPFCRLNSNGELECVIAPNRRAMESQSEENVVPVLIDRRHELEDKIMNFKEVKGNWKDNMGQILGR